ncbi:MAG: MBL fold metallo-hydrolase [Actinobacteria bacterium]|nr:MBL fold metallo-hydrolase [Actinomycetota bacterium]
MAGIPFVGIIDPLRYAEAEVVSPKIRRVIARNPSNFTFTGTGTYLVGNATDVAVIDPGPDLPEHRTALLRAIEGQKVRAIVITHCHSDHVGLAAWLREETGAPTVAWKPHGAVGQLDNDEDIKVMQSLAPPPKTEEEKEKEREIARAAGLDPDDLEIRESVDLEFEPDVRVGDGEVAAHGDGWTLIGIHTPGHTSNHMCVAFEEEKALFTGDHIMGWSTTVVSPPDGDMRDYMESVKKLQLRDDKILWPTHGSPVTDPQPFLRAYYEHRLGREAQVLACVAQGVNTVAPMVRQMYAAVIPELHIPAARSVLSHLTQLVQDGRLSVRDGGPARLSSTYELG